MKFIRLLKKRGKSGFTLVEVVISCVLLGILILGVFSVVTPIISGVKSREQSANALMLAEAAEMYIDRSIKNSVFVAIFENAKPDDMKEDGAIPKSPQMAEMLAFINNSDNKDAAGNDIYELKCIAIKWEDDPKHYSVLDPTTAAHSHKYMIYTETIDKTTGAVKSGTTSYPVFEVGFYENLYPQFTFDNIFTVNVLNDDGTVKMKDGEPVTEDVEKLAVHTVINVYRDEAMTDVALIGDGYADLTNIKRQQTTGYYKLFSKNGMKDDDGNIIPDTGTVLTNTFLENERPETYVYFVTRKLKATTSATPSP
ncbi:MAG: type II secretion system GspH family protein [Ruminococcus sp.]|nr:type II secretion system GspH family protein [Ruminococcus sp.]